MDQLEAMGWSRGFAAALHQVDPTGQLAPARVSEERKGGYRLLWAAGDLRAEISGRLLYQAAGPEDLPVVGDWVAVAPRPEESAGTIQHVLPRRTAVVRSAPERPTRAQVLAANVDSVFLVTSANRDFNPRRIERTLAVIWQSGAEPVLILSKRDLCEDLGRVVAEAEAAALGVAVLPLSSLTGQGLEALEPLLLPGRTTALLGSSGVGKSTLLNRLLGRELQATREVREDDDRGRHATTHRQLFPLPGGGVLLDTPGLREIGLWSQDDALDSAFPEIDALARQCRFHDCRHQGEPGCAVAEAVDSGRLDPARLASQRKLERELRRVEERRDGRARHERRKRARAFSRQIRQLPDKRRR